MTDDHVSLLQRVFWHSIELGLNGIILEVERPVRRIVPRAGDR